MKLSIITPTLNAADFLADCITSVERQSEQEVEHVIVDGGSTDETLDIVRNSDYIHKLVVEERPGLYQAINTGIAHCSGEVIGILNADDVYSDMTVLHKVVETFSTSTTDSTYGDLVYVNRMGKVIRRWRAGTFERGRFLNGWMPPHPTFFVRSSVYNRYGPYRTDLGSAADYELMLRLLFKEQISSTYIPQELVRMRTGGMSNRSLDARLKANRMDRKAWEVNDLTPFPWTTWFKPLRKLGQWFTRD